MTEKMKLRHPVTGVILKILKSEYNPNLHGDYENISVKSQKIPAEVEGAVEERLDQISDAVNEEIEKVEKAGKSASGFVKNFLNNEGKKDDEDT